MAIDSKITHAREQMVAEVRSVGVNDEQVLAVMNEIPRHLFVPKRLRYLAYENVPIDIGNGQTISQPSMVGIMTQLLKVQEDEKVLEIGTGSGYQAAVLSKLVRSVYTIERIPTLARRADRLLRSLGYDNVTVVIGNGTKGLPHEAPFDAIMVTAGAPAIPESLVSQLREHGRIAIPVGNIQKYQQLIVGVKRHEELLTREVTPVQFVPLIGEEGWKEH